MTFEIAGPARSGTESAPGEAGEDGAEESGDSHRWSISTDWGRCGVLSAPWCAVVGSGLAPRGFGRGRITRVVAHRGQSACSSQQMATPRSRPRATFGMVMGPSNRMTGVRHGRPSRRPVPRRRPAGWPPSRRRHSGAERSGIPHRWSDPTLVGSVCSSLVCPGVCLSGLKLPLLLDLPEVPDG